MQTFGSAWKVSFVISKKIFEYNLLNVKCDLLSAGTGKHYWYGTNSDEQYVMSSWQKYNV